MPADFVWYELMTDDLAAATAFYTTILGWTAEPFPGMDGYQVMNVGGFGVAGLMAIPDEARNAGAPPAWTGYIYAQDVDAAVVGLKAAGGSVHHEPTDIPGVGRFAVVGDPQGAMFSLLAPLGESPTAPPPMTPGLVGWHELLAADWESAFEFYAGQFGWTKDQTMDMGPMGTYQLFAAGDAAIGGMMTKPAEVPSPFWLYYFNVADIDAGTRRVADNKGQILMGPMEVPGGGWITQCMDPQGAMFALIGPRVH